MTQQIAERDETRELVKHQAQAVESVLPKDVMELGKVLVQSGYFQDAKDASQAVVKILAGRELGFGPIASMMGVHIVKSRPVLSANLTATLVRRGGRYDYRLIEATNERCVIEFTKHGRLVGSSIFTMEDAKRAGIASGDNWTKYPRNMLFARAMTNGAKWYCADALQGAVPMAIDAGDLAEPELDVDLETGEILSSSEARDEAPVPPPAVLLEVPEVHAPPEGDPAPNWPRFWVYARDDLGLSREEVHEAFHVPPDKSGALRDYAGERAEAQGKPLTQVVMEMQDELARRAAQLRGQTSLPEADGIQRAPAEEAP